MSFLSLSPELIEEIAFYLRAHDIAALALSCRRFRDIVQDSILLQYAYRTDLAGVYDPLRDLSRCSILDRMESLRRWEASWADLGRYLSAGPRLVIPAERDLFGPFFLRDDYLFAVDWQGHPTGLRQPALLYVDLRDALRSGQHSWRQIHYPLGSIAITQAFSIEENDLVVSVLSLPRLRSTATKTKTVLRFMSLEMGGAHPLAREPDLQLDTELSVNQLDVRADVIGDQIVLVLVDLRTQNPESDAIYLVDWKKGQITLVHRAPNGTYEGALAVLSPDLVLFLRRNKPCLELCRVTTTSSRGTEGSSDGDGASSASLRVVRTLALPNFLPEYRVHTAYMQTDRYSPRQSDPEASHQQQRLARAPAPLTFHSAPEDMVAGITFLLRLQGPPMNWKKVVTTISHRALFALAATSRPRRQTRYGGDNDGEREQQEEEEEEMETEMVPWEEWGPHSARVISPPTFHWITAHAGQRWLSLEDNKLVVRDFSAARVRRARASSAHASSSPASLRHRAGGPGTAAVPVLAPAQTRIWGGSGCFGQDVVSELPFLETRVDLRGRVGDMVLTDGERLISFVRAGQPPKFEVYVLEDDDEEQQEQDEDEWEHVEQEEEGGSSSSRSSSSHTPAAHLNLAPRGETETGVNIS